MRRQNSSPKLHKSNKKKPRYSVDQIDKSTRDIHIPKHQRRTTNLDNPTTMLRKSLAPQMLRASLTSTVTPVACSAAGTQVHTPRFNPNKHFKYFYQIGFGSLGRVWKVRQQSTGEQYALKEMLKSKVIDKGTVQAVLSQKNILSRLKHPFLINMHRSFQNSHHLYLQLDYLRGADLRYHICYRQRFSQQQIIFIIACVITALLYMHSQGVVHRDIKPQNIVFQETGYARLTDFGIAQAISSKKRKDGQISGTPVYMAPEILFGSKYSQTSDFYSLGIIIFELVMGHRPYKGKSRNQVRQQLTGREICLVDYQMPQNYSSALCSFINGLLKKNSNERLGSRGGNQLKQHPLFRGLRWDKLQNKQLKPPFVPHVISQTQNYLNEIQLFNQMNPPEDTTEQFIDSQHDAVFGAYDCDLKSGALLAKKKKLTTKKKRGSQLHFRIS